MTEKTLGPIGAAILLTIMIGPIISYFLYMGYSMADEAFQEQRSEMLIVQRREYQPSHNRILPGKITLLQSQPESFILCFNIQAREFCKAVSPERFNSLREGQPALVEYTYLPLSKNSRIKKVG
jgi:hypothetical protein